MTGKIICDLAPREFNNRNSEGAFIKLKNGNILFSYTRYRGCGFADECIADIYGMLSADEGETFGTPFWIFSCEDVNADNIISVSLMRMKNNDIGLFYLQKNINLAVKEKPLRRNARVHLPLGILYKGVTLTPNL